LVYLVTNAIYNAYFHPLSKFPGPKLWAASHIPIAISISKGSYSQKVKELHDVYGPVVRIAPNELAFAEADAVRDMAAKPSLRKSLDFYLQTPGKPTSILSVSAC
jgi:hypothetical protein